MFNPVHHHCHLFTDFYKKFICVEFRPLLIVRKSNTLIFWRACLLVVPAGFDPRIYNIKTLHFNSSVDNVPLSKWFSNVRGILKTQCLPFNQQTHGNTFGGVWGFQNNQAQQVFKRSKNFETMVNNGSN